METENRFDWYWQPPIDLNSTQILTDTKACIALDSIKQDTQIQCKQVESQHQSHAMKMQQALDKINK